MLQSVGCLVVNHEKEYLTEANVPISPQTSINELKQLLKEMEPTIIGDLDLNMLKVWKCTALETSDDADKDELQESLLTLDLSNKETARQLRPTLNVLSLGVKASQRLLVQVPSPLWCLFVDLDQKPISLFPVTVSRVTTVFDVSKMVSAQVDIKIGATQAAVWRCFGLKSQGPEEDDQVFEARVRTFDLSNNRHAEKLPPICRVSKLMIPPDEILLVQFPNVRQDKRKRGDNPPSALKRLRADIAEAPSVLAVPSQFQKITGPERGIALNHPFEPCTIPLVLLHGAFATFKDRYKEAPSKQALICLNELTPVACQWYDVEFNRRTVIKTIIERHTGLRNLAIIVMPAAIRECKNEHGNVLNQAILYYANFLKNAYQDSRHFYNFSTRFPSILMIDMGPYLGFYGAVWDGERVRVENLTPLFDLSTHSKETKARWAIAASFDALIAAVNDIKAHYDSIEAEANMNPPPEMHDRDLHTVRGYPFLTSYEDGGQEISFMYNKRLHNEKLVFSAAIVNQPDSDEFIVKFTSCYSEDAHNCLASHDLAPRLRQCVRISADWMAIIMDKSKYRMHLDLTLSDADKERVRRKVTNMAKTLHQEGFVHGDIRESNILIDDESLTSDDVKIHLIDLDWAGPIGEAKYPADVNKITVKRPDGVEGGGLITKQHDIDMASFLFP